MLAATSLQCLVPSHSWRHNASHADSACNIPVLDGSADGEPLTRLAQLCAHTHTPLLIRGLMDRPGWRAVVQALGDWSDSSAFGTEMVILSLSRFLNSSPEAQSAELDAEKLAFMQEHWGAAASGGASAMRRSLWQQVLRGEPRPLARLGDVVAAMQADALPPDAYVFHNVTGTSLGGAALAPLRSLWRAVVALTPRPSSARMLARIGVGGSGSGAGFHDHELALNLGVVGRKRWLVARPGRRQVPASTPSELLHQVLPSAAFQRAWNALAQRGQTWECTQRPGDVVLVPETFLHATVNLDHSIALAVQAES